MDRLTYRRPKFNNPVSNGACKDITCSDECDSCKINDLIAKLCAYEDTGLEPEEIADAVIAAKLMAKSKIVSCFGVDADHVRELVEAEQDGRMAVLPVKKGTKIFRVVDIPEHKCQGRMRGHYFPSTKRIYKGVMQWEDGSDFGKTVFLTREEAEAALKGGAE